MADIDALVLNTVNAPWKRRIDAATLASCLSGGRDLEAWRVHVRTFFEEVPLEAIFRFLLAHDLPADRVRAVYRASGANERSGGDGELDHWLGELAAAAG